MFVLALAVVLVLVRHVVVGWPWGVPVSGRWLWRSLWVHGGVEILWTGVEGELGARSVWIC